MELHRAGEDFLKAVLILQSKNGSVRSVDIADMLHVSKASVSVSVKLLREGGFLTMDAEKQISLTDIGREVAEGVYEKHHILTRFLCSLGVEPDIADTDACRMEHVISPQTLERIKDCINKEKEGQSEEKKALVVRPRRRLT